MWVDRPWFPDVLSQKFIWFPDVLSRKCYLVVVSLSDEQEGGSGRRLAWCYIKLNEMRSISYSSVTTATTLP